MTGWISGLRLAGLIGLWLLAAAPPAKAGDPFPPPLSVTYVATPAPIVQNGTTRLYYEMVITNFSPAPYVLETIYAKAGVDNETFKGDTLAAMIRPLGEKPAKDDDKKAARTIAGGRSIVVFVELDLGKDEAPDIIAHSFEVTDDKGKLHEMQLGPLEVSTEKPIVVGAPLRGEWIAGDSASNRPDAAHRRALMVDNGQAWLAQRFAIDWVQYEQVGDKRTTWKGPEDKNESYFCYGKPIYSVAAGKVVDASDGMADNVPHSGKHAVEINFNNAGGNHAVVEIAPHRYVLYAHLKPGTLKVKAGDKVEAGQVIGNVGNTGSSEEPHLHMHIDDQPSFLAGNGVPYEFESGDASGPVEANVSSPTAIYFGEIGKQKPFKNDYPAENALVTFK